MKDIKEIQTKFFVDNNNIILTFIDTTIYK